MDRYPDLADVQPEKRLGAMLKLDGRHDAALTTLGRSLTLREQLRAEDQTSADAARDVAVSHESLCEAAMWEALAQVTRAPGHRGRASARGFIVPSRSALCAGYLAPCIAAATSRWPALPMSASRRCSMPSSGSTWQS